jgi:hypothetical protein
MRSLKLDKILIPDIEILKTKNSSDQLVLDFRNSKNLI